MFINLCLMAWRIFFQTLAKMVDRSIRCVSTRCGRGQRAHDDVFNTGLRYIRLSQHLKNNYTCKFPLGYLCKTCRSFHRIVPCALAHVSLRYCWIDAVHPNLKSIPVNDTSVSVCEHQKYTKRMYLCVYKTRLREHCITILLTRCKVDSILLYVGAVVESLLLVYDPYHMLITLD